MKITNVRTMLVEGPDTHGIGGIGRTIYNLLVRVDTDSGEYGLGEAANFLGDREGMAYAKEWLKGKDPLAINPFIRVMLSGGLPPYDPQMSPTATVDGGVVWAVSGIEMALCDLAGKILKTPVYNLLGGAFRQRIRIYLDRSGVVDPTDISQWRALAQRVRDEGFADYKFDAEWIAPELSQDPWNRQMRAEQVRHTYERLAAVREVAGPDAEIALDGHMSFDVETAIRLARALEPLNLKWFEDPVPIINFDAQKRVRDESPIPICAGEMLVPDQFREMIDRRAVDIIHPDLLMVGGLHEAKKVADYADMNAIPLAIHNNGGGMNTIASAHLAAACPNFIGLECHFWGARWAGEIVRREGVPLFDEQGFVPLTDAPGYGVEIDEAMARKHLSAGPVPLLRSPGRRGIAPTASSPVEDDHRPGDVAAFQLVEAVIDVGQRQPHRDHLVEVELAAHREVGELRKVDPRPAHAVRRAHDLPLAHQDVERERDLLAQRRSCRGSRPGRPAGTLRASAGS